MRLLAFVLLVLLGAPAAAQTDWAARLSEGDVILRDFQFNSGETPPELRIHYATLGTPRRDARGNIVNAVMLLHGTGGSGRQFLQPQFADELFGPGQPLDIAHYYIILPDGIGHGRSSKPSDGLRMRFPAYDYDDMVWAQLQLMEQLGVRRLRLLFGTSMGCMHIFLWARTHSDDAQAMMPMACLPTEIAGHNRMWRRAAVEGIRSDPAWANGNYTTQPLQGLRTAVSLLQMAGFAPYYLQRAYPDRETAEAYIVDRIARDLPTRDANDLIYQLEASRTYNPLPYVEQFYAHMTWINSADDFINPPDYGIAEAAARRMLTVRYVLIPASAETRGHGTHTWARFWKDELVDLLRRTDEAGARPAAAETILIRFRQPYGICIGECPHFSMTVSSRGEVVTHDLIGPLTYRFRATPLQLRTFQDILDSIRPVGERRLDAACARATNPDGTFDELDDPRPDDVEIRWIGAHATARLTECARTHSAMRQTVRTALRALGANTLGRRATNPD